MQDTVNEVQGKVIYVVINEDMLHECTYKGGIFILSADEFIYIEQQRVSSFC